MNRKVVERKLCMNDLKKQKNKCRGANGKPSMNKKIFMNYFEYERKKVFKKKLLIKNYV